MDEIGRYGGTIRRALTGDIVQTAGVNKTLSEGLVGYHRPLPTSIETVIQTSFWLLIPALNIYVTMEVIRIFS